VNVTITKSRRRRKRTRLASLLSGAALLAVIALAAWRFYAHFHRAAERSASPVTLTLPFTIPCAVVSNDAVPVYAALRKRDRRQLSQLFEDKRMVSVKKGVPVRMFPFGDTTMVTTANGSHPEASCFVPSNIVPVIRKHLSG
jgi:hypothetical protein